MMYPRLQVSRDLLTDDGVISIDYNEVHSMRKICDEIFGENNLVGKLLEKSKVWLDMIEQELIVNMNT